MRARWEERVEPARRGPDESLLAENARLEAQLDGLHRALQSRATIEQAKGVLMALRGCSEADAFDLLVRLSQRRNVRLRSLAEVLVQLAADGLTAPREDGLCRWLQQELALPGKHRVRPPAGRASGRAGGRRNDRSSGRAYAR
jgi:hypothetical protein